MKVSSSRWFVVAVTFLVGCGSSFAVKAQTAAEGDSPAELNPRIVELFRAGKYKEAIPLAEKVVVLMKRAKGDEDPDTAASLETLGSLYYETGDYARAEPLLKEALEIRQKILGREHPDTVTSLNNLALLYKAMGNYTKAEPLYKQALEIRQKGLGPNHPLTALSLNNLAALYFAMGDYTRAEPMFKEALEIRQKVLGPEHSFTVSSLNNLAALYEATGDYAKAEPLYKGALEIRQKVLGRLHPDTATSLDGLAGLYREMGDYGKAEPLYREALEIRQKTFGREHPDTATSLNNLALLYRLMGDYAKAEALYNEALTIRQKTLGPEHPAKAQTLNNLAVVYEMMGDYAKAEPLLKKALEIRQKTLGPEHLDTAESLSNLAGLYWRTDEYTRAEPLYKEALEIYRKVLGLEHPNTATSLNNLASVYQAMGDYANAELLCKEALEIRQKVLGPEHPYTAESLNNLAFAEFALGRIKEARTLARRVSDAQHNLLAKMFSFSSEPQRLAYLATLNPYSLFVLLPGCEADLALALLRYKGVVLDSVIEDRLLAQASTNAEDQNRVERLKADQRQLDQLLLQAPNKLSEASQQVEKLEEEVEHLQGQLAQHVAGLGQARRALGVTLEQVQACLPRHGALIEYLRYVLYMGKRRTEPAYGALVLLPEGDPRWIPLGNAEKIDKLVKRFGRLAGGNGGDDELAANLEALYEAVWAPLEPQLPEGTQRLIISPDSQLNFVSLAALVTPQGQFLSEKFKFQYVASGRELLQERPSTLSRNVVLFADPDFGTNGPVWPSKTSDRSPSQSTTQWHGTEKRGLQGVNFDPLPGTLAESERLQQLFEAWHWPTQLRSGKEATKFALVEVRSPFILHLATHGFFEPQEHSDDVFESADYKANMFQSKFFANPMHQSGLAFTGANVTLSLWGQGQEAPSVDNDGILTAEDVSTMNLQGTWLVTLSACDTAKGEARAGEGVMGLRRGFAQAGAENLLLTLWAVSDQTTVQIMADFYEAAHKSGNPPEALAEVQRKWLLKLRSEKGLAQAVNLAGPFIMSSQGKP